jgi:hypothetical protein
MGEQDRRDESGRRTLWTHTSDELWTHSIEGSTIRKLSIRGKTWYVRHEPGEPVWNFELYETLGEARHR